MSDVEGTPNLTPILDMVFQLITFFIMLANFKAVSIDTSLNLPVVGSARPVDTQGQTSLVILNIDQTGDLKVYGESKPIASYIASQAWVELLAARMTREDLAAGKELPTLVVVRADRATPFKLLNRVLKECQLNGFRRFALKAMDK
jgi:biopolymer transport protein ExbD